MRRENVCATEVEVGRDDQTAYVVCATRCEGIRGGDFGRRDQMGARSCRDFLWEAVKWWRAVLSIILLASLDITTGHRPTLLMMNAVYVFKYH